MSESEDLNPTLDAGASAGSDESRRFGPYRLLDRLGAGGMGEVWRAEQKGSLRRLVALKIIKRGLDTERALARFESERQALAMMDHPFIASVFDAGSTPDGRPYFAMELVRGVPITEHCDQARLSTRKRLRLFLDVCEGVAHAHQKAILHRDLKPSNILVSVEEDRAIPKIIDFGLAKALTGRLSKRTLYTEYGQMLGTPAFMSPEQAELGLQQADTRTDVYSLGVLLYLLVCGSLPFDASSFEGNHDAARKVILENDPPRPSTRVSDLKDAESESCAKMRATDRRTLVSELRGDLDWITMKALAKDRRQRYSGVGELAADVERYLDSRPVLARPPSLSYSVGRWVKRHRVAALTSGLVALALVAGLAAALWGLSRARASERVALAEAARAGAVSDFLVDLFESSDPGRSRGAEITAREVLDSGVSRIDGALESEPATRASLLEVMGRVYTSLGLYGEARPLLDEAVALRRELGNETDQAEALKRLATAVSWQGDDAEALVMAEEAFGLIGSGPPSEAKAELLNALGNIHQNLGERERARTTHQQALEMRREVSPSDYLALAQSSHNLGIAEWLLGNAEDARDLFESAIDYEERHSRSDASADSKSGDSYTLATSLHVLALLMHRDLDRSDEALPLARRAGAMRERVLGPAHPHVALSHGAVGEMLLSVGDAEAAVESLTAGLEIGESVWAVTHGDNRWLRATLAEALGAAGRSAEAEDHLRLLIDKLGEDGPEQALAPNLNRLGALLAGRDDTRGAIAAYERALELERRYSGETSPYLLDALMPLERLFGEHGNSERRVAVCREMSGLVASLADGDSRVAEIESRCVAG